MYAISLSRNLNVTYVFAADEASVGSSPNLVRLRIEPLSIHDSTPCMDSITLADGEPGEI